MKKQFQIILFMVFIVTLTACGSTAPENDQKNGELIAAEEPALTYYLPSPDTDGDMSVESALQNRRSQRSFQDKALSAYQLSQILWAAYGITDDGRGFRTAPSAGALYPLEIYAIVGNVEGIDPGAYKYIAEGHKIVMVVEGDVRDQLSEAVFSQRMVTEAPAAIFYSGVFSRTTERYGDRGNHFVYIEVGHSAQNVYLQAESLGLGVCAIGTVTDVAREILDLPPDEDPLYLMPIGYTE